MKRNRRKNCILLILLCLGFGLSGCDKKQEETIELTMIHGWGSTIEDHVVMRQIYEDFEKVHPEIRLNLISMPSSAEVIDKVGDLLTVGEIPDIVFTGGEGKDSIYSFMVQKGYAVDIMPYIKADEEFAGNVSPFILERWETVDGELYTISDVLLMGGYWYNQQIFKEAGVEKVPATWDEWFDMCKKVGALSAAGSKPLVSVVLDREHIAYLTAALFADEGDVGLTDIGNSKIVINEKAFLNTLEILKKVSSSSARLEEEYNYLDTLSCFNKGESAVYINGVWANMMISEDLPVAHAAFPSKDGEGIATRSACVGYILGNTGDEKRISASVEFLKYMLSDEVAERILVSTGQIPSNPNIEITRQNSSDRMKQAVDCVEAAGMIIEIPENFWDLRSKKEYEKNMILYLKGDILKEEFFEKVQGYSTDRE